MANFTVCGRIEKISFLPNGRGCAVYIVEFKKGFRKRNGEIVADRYDHWKCIFPQGQMDYINTHFNKTDYVEVKGEISPFAIEKDVVVDGYSVLGQTLNFASYPPRNIEPENKMIKESQLHSVGNPNMEEFMQDDF